MGESYRNGAKEDGATGLGAPPPTTIVLPPRVVFTPPNFNGIVNGNVNGNVHGNAPGSHRAYKKKKTRGSDSCCCCCCCCCRSHTLSHHQWLQDRGSGTVQIV